METERHSPRYNAIEAWSPGDILEAMIEGQFAAVAAVRTARPALEKAALAIEPRLRDGGRPRSAGAIRRGRRRRGRRGDKSGAALRTRSARCADRSGSKRNDAIHPR